MLTLRCGYKGLEKTKMTSTQNLKTINIHLAWKGSWLSVKSHTYILAEANDLVRSLLVTFMKQDWRASNKEVLSTH